MRNLLADKLTISSLKKMYKDDVITPREVIAEIIDKASKYEDYNIFVIPPSFDFVNDYLKNLDGMNRNLPLYGIPFVIKDNIDLENKVTTAGCEDFGYVAKSDAQIVKRLIEAGAIPIGKTTLDQFATGLVGTRTPYGAVKNSLNKELIAGGSSSGSAVAVSLGIAAFALGTDTAGSGRVPAMLNGIIGFKPSLGAWEKQGIVPACESIDTATVFTNLIDDAITIDKILRKYNKDDKWSKHVSINFEKNVNELLIPEEDLVFFGKFSEDFKASYHKTIECIRLNGMQLKEIDYTIFKKSAKLLYDGPFVSERTSAVGDFIMNNPDSVLEVTRNIILSGNAKECTATQLFNALHMIEEYKKQAKHLLENKILMLPTAGGTYSIEEVNNDPINTNSNMGLYTNHCNLLDLCAIAIPCGTTENNLPFGVTLFSRSGNEGLLFNTARKIMSVFENTVKVAVFGLHMRGFPLEKQMIECGAKFVEETKTNSCYKMYAIDDGLLRPGVIKSEKHGTRLDVETWEMPVSMLGELLVKIEAPLGLGTIELNDQTNCIGFICEGIVVNDYVDISEFGGWRNYVDGLSY